MSRKRKREPDEQKFIAAIKYGITGPCFADGSCNYWQAAEISLTVAGDVYKNK